MRIENINDFLIKNSNSVSTNKTNETSSFNEVLKGVLDEVNQLQKDSDNYTKLLALGQVDNVHDVTIASEKAKLALQMTLTVRNKVVDAYKEIMRMQV
ncbi:Flagellar hook-basal body complex protein fliE [Proteiniborus sp. DW1]|uniref:flagellar hook-basal body complex protein FliE n=1 Tax=Proteiniborus sp. DW1 TaxID=1889883 RepID=UPI00092E1472|nr:flagellar hook-basal body complex protein FliE [Proteiniborus sp. DW1]SCG83456.1 Flagellar hook-basal body complex protein fliE [Proteiniborus sp. DW1]